MPCACLRLEVEPGLGYVHTKHGRRPLPTISVGTDNKSRARQMTVLSVATPKAFILSTANDCIVSGDAKGVHTEHGK